MAKDPAMLFYTSDFLTGVTLLSMKERGQYITLLCLQQQMGHMSMQQMQTAVGKMSPGLLDKFVQDEEGLYYNRRADLEISKRKAHCDKQRQNIEKRWSKNEDVMALPNEYHGITMEHSMVIPLENENENNKAISSDKAKREEQFNQFWEVYPRKVGKQAARKAFDKIPVSVWPKLVPAVEAQKRSFQWTREGGQFVPHPATWLNQGRWDDDVDPVKPAPTNKKVLSATEYEAPRPKTLDDLRKVADSL